MATSSVGMALRQPLQRLWHRGSRRLALPGSRVGRLALQLHGLGLGLGWAWAWGVGVGRGDLDSGREAAAERKPTSCGA